MSVKGTKTEQNLLAAFSGESQARNKYTYFASVANKEGYKQVAAIFQETADNEKEHAKVHFKYLSGIGSTLENLKAAAEGENYEHSQMYPNFAEIAREEGFEEIAVAFEEIGKVEQAHEARYKALSLAIEEGKVFKKDTSVKWHCRNCGAIIEGDTAPHSCPACKHPQAHFEVLAENY